MNRDEFISLDKIIGFQLKYDVFTKNKVLLIGSSTVLTREHIRLLELHGITLTHTDVRTIGPYSSVSSNPESEFVDEIVCKLHNIFQEIAFSKKIMLGEIRKQIVPMVQHIVDQPTLIKIFSALQSKDDYIYRHHVAVAILTMLIGKWINLDDSELLQLTTAALLHDVGKLRIPPEILNNPNKLTSEEFEIMKKHTIHGYQMIKQTIGASHRQALVALQHHERSNGKGYPFGIKEANIDLFSRIVSIADVFHAITSNRVYGEAFPFFEAVEEMEKSAFGALDPTIVRIFISKIMQYLIGSKVLLTNGTNAVIVMINPFDPIRPMVQTNDSFLDLCKEPSVQIKQIIT